MTDHLPKILVCDDSSKRVEAWTRTISEVDDVGSQFLVEPLGPEEFAQAYNALKRRQIASRAGKAPEASDEGDAAGYFDQAAMVVIDYDLTPTSDADNLDEPTVNALSGSFGDNVAFLARTFSTASYAVLVNQDYFQSTFDLTHMRFASSTADLNVAHNDLGRPELWLGKSDGQAFRPWHWPRLVDVPGRYASLAAEIDLDAPILESLGLADEETYKQFVPEQLELLGPEPISLKFRDAPNLLQAFAHAGKLGPNLSDDAMKRVAVGVVTRWLEHLILPAQNVLIDAPHLVQRRPGFARENDPGAWAPLTDLQDEDAVLALLNTDLLVDATIPNLSRWVSRPVWLWHRCPRVSSPPVEPYVFCEDVSAFHPLDDAQEYVSSLPGPHRQRFIREASDHGNGLPVDYRPSQRLFAYDEPN